MTKQDKRPDCDPANVDQQRLSTLACVRAGMTASVWCPTREAAAEEARWFHSRLSKAEQKLIAFRVPIKDELVKRGAR